MEEIKGSIEEEPQLSMNKESKSPLTFINYEANQNFDLKLKKMDPVEAAIVFRDLEQKCTQAKDSLKQLKLRSEDSPAIR